MWFLTGIAFASSGGFEDITKLISQKKYKQVLRQIEHFEGQFQSPEKIVSTADLVYLWVYRGYIYHLRNDEEKSTKALQQALAMHANFSLVQQLRTDAEFVKKLTSLRGQTKQRTPLNIGRPNLYSKERFYINGRSVQRNFKIYAGQHLVQVKCASDKVVSFWTSFDQEPRWDALCYDSYVVSQSSPAKIPTKKIKVALWSIGGTSLVAGLAYHLLVVTPLHQDINTAREDPLSIYRKEANTLTNSFQSARRNSGVLFSAGVSFIGVGFAIPLQ